MRIYIPLWQNDAHESGNPFVSTYTDAIQKNHSDVDFRYGKDFLWEKECEEYDILHFMWPHFYDVEINRGFDLEGRIVELKSKGVRIVSTCHNLKSHFESNMHSANAYSIVYKNSDVIIHLGNYSLGLLKEKYPNAHHVHIPHHVYDTIYTLPAPKDVCLKYLGLKKDKKYILCFGNFRNKDEIDLVKSAAEGLKQEGYYILAPSIIKTPKWNRHPVEWLKLLVRRYQYEHCGIITRGQFVSDDDLPYYYGASEISFLQRLEILNSGNLPLGFFMGKVVVGPCVGNVAEILKVTSNPYFNPSQLETVIPAIKAGLQLTAKGKGEENQKYAMSHFSTQEIAEKHFVLYRMLSER